MSARHTHMVLFCSIIVSILKNCGIGYDRQHTVCHEEQQRASFQLESTEKRDSDERNQSQIHQIKKIPLRAQVRKLVK